MHFFKELEVINLIVVKKNVVNIIMCLFTEYTYGEEHRECYCAF